MIFFIRLFRCFLLTLFRYFIKLFYLHFFSFFSRDADSIKGTFCPFCVPIHKKKTSSAFFCNWSLSSVLEAASWRSNTVFTSFYLRDLQYVHEGVRSLGPFVAAGERIG